MVRTITTVDELNALRRRSARRGVKRVALELISPATLRTRLEAPINRHLASCGCVTGAAFVAAGMIALTVAAFQVPGPIGFGRVAQALGILLAIGLTGKIIGLLAAEYRLRRAIGAAVNALGNGACGNDAPAQAAEDDVARNDRSDQVLEI